MPVRGLTLVVGGSGAIGGAISRDLHRAGHRVVVADVDAEGVGAVAAEFGGIGLLLDITDAGAVDEALAGLHADHGPVGVCVHAAGWDEFRPFVDTDEAFTSKVIDINYMGVVRVTRAVLPGMIDAGWGRVISIASDAGRVGSSLEAIYSGAKGAVIAFSKAVAREVARNGVTVNSVCPGPTITPMLERGAAALPEPQRFISALERAVPMRRLGEPEDVAPVVTFLASEEAGFVTGQTVSVSGGLTMA